MFKQPLDSTSNQLNTTKDPLWFKNMRAHALSQYKDLGLPTRQSELWKYTDVSRLKRLAEVTDVADGNENFVFTIEGDLAKTTQIQSIFEINESEWTHIQTDADRVFVALNAAVLTDGFVLNIPDNTQLKLHIQYQQTSKSWQHLRTIINIGKNSQLDLTESYDYDCRINHVSVINAQTNAHLKLQSNKFLSNSAALIHYSQINCASRVQIQQCCSNNNAFLAHTICVVNFNGEQCNYQSASINVTHSSSHVAQNTHTNHRVGNCTSHVIKRSLATDKSQISINSKAVVAVAADGSNVYQSLKNIIQSHDAKIYSKPELEINTNDVIAAHGSTIGELDQNALTYLRSRGISKEQAQFILIESFLQEANLFKNQHFLDRIEL